MKITKILSVRQKQVIILFLVSIVWAAGAIVHGIYFDLDFDQIKRLSVLGVIFSTIVIFPSILIFEYIFDWNNMDDIRKIHKRLDDLESKINEFSENNIEKN